MLTLPTFPRFTNKIALITGAASGMGRAAAYRLAAEGAHILIADRDAAGSQAVAETIRAQGGQADVFHVDLAQDDEVRRLAESIATRFPAVHVLVHNAFINISGMLETGSWQQDWEPGTIIGLKAPALLTQQLLPQLRAEGAAIVNISSDGGFRGRKGMWLYDAMKAALVSWTKSMACELVADGIRVNAIAPGWIITEIHAQKHPDPQARLKELANMQTDSNLMGRLGFPEEIAAGIAFLASEEASFITGTTLHIDGGRVGINVTPATLTPRE